MADFAILYDRYIKKIYNFIYYKTTHKETAEDLTSQAFFKALAAINRFDPAQGSFSSWLFRIARNTVIDHYRTKKHNANIDDIWDMADNTDIERDIDANMRLADVGQYMAKLPGDQREIIIMRVWQDMSYHEIAAILGKSEDACKMSFSRAINKLRQEIGVAALLTLLFWNL